MYVNYAKAKFIRYINYQIMIDHLKKNIQFELIPNIYQRPEKPKLLDPVIDPRETWKEFIKRHIEFEDPPMCERSELPIEMQPQNRLLGKIRHYINGLSPYPGNYYQQQQKTQ